jgi:hypothetical protein
MQIHRVPIDAYACVQLLTLVSCTTQPTHLDEIVQPLSYSQHSPGKREKQKSTALPKAKTASQQHLHLLRMRHTKKHQAASASQKPSKTPQNQQANTFAPH